MASIDDAIKVAKRSSIRTHRTGCVIADTGGKIVSNGWSHIPHYKLKSKRSLHAEIHALARARHLNLNRHRVYVAAIISSSGNVVNSMPCLDCAIALKAAGISIAFYSTHYGYHWIDLLSDLPFADLKVYSEHNAS